MKAIVMVATLAVVTVTPALADMPGRGWISSARVTRMLAAKGYHVTKIEADDGHWEGEARRRGARFEFHVDPHSGRITKMERDHD